MTIEPRVYSATHQHKHGETCRVFRTNENALEWRREIADEWWTREMKGEPPKDRQEMADAYFEHVNDYGEYFTLVECTLED